MTAIQASASPCSVEIVRTPAELHTLRPEWNALAESFASPLLQHEWFAAAADAFLDSDRLCVFVARRDGEVRAIAPMVLSGVGPLNRLRLLGHQTLEPAGLLYADEEALGAVIDALLSFRVPMELRRLGADSPAMRLLQQRSAPGTIRHVRAGHSASTWIALPSTAQELEAAMSAGRARELRRNRRKAEAAGSVALLRTDPTPETVDTLFDRFCRIEVANWKGHVGTAIVLNPRMHRFYSTYARAAADKGLLRFFFLRIGVEDAAAAMLLESGGRLWELKIGYDEAWSKCSPGVLLSHEILSHACERGLQAYEFLGGAEAWQDRWPNRHHTYSTLRTFPLSLSGSYYLARDAGAQVTKIARRAVARLGVSEGVPVGAR